MKGFGIGLLIGGILVFLILAVIGLSMNSQDSQTGETIKTLPAPQQTTEQVLVDNQQSLKENMVYYQTFEVLTFAKVSVNITSDDLFNYALLPDYELDHYLKGESYKSFESSEGLLFIQDSYNLDVGKYSVVITSLDKPTDFHLIIKATTL